jgi:hypothetical protein
MKKWYLLVLPLLHSSKYKFHLPNIIIEILSQLHPRRPQAASANATERPEQR